MRQHGIMILVLLLLACLLAQGCRDEPSDTPSPADEEATKDSGGGLKHDSQPQFRPYRPVSASGLTSLGIDVVRTGRGVVIKEGDWIQATYTGTLADGTVFDSTESQARPFKLEEKQVIEGWLRGLIGQREGAIVKLEIPASMAYGDKAKGKVPANADLYFEIEIVKVN